MKWSEVGTGYHWVEGDGEPYIAQLYDAFDGKYMLLAGKPYPLERFKDCSFYEVPTIEELERVRGIEILHNIRNGNVK